MARKIFTDKERHILGLLVNDYKDIIENKKTDGSTLREKAEVWKKIETYFNSRPYTTNRTTQQLKKCWENMKQRRRKINMEAVKYTKGDMSPQVEDDPIGELVDSIVPHISVDYPWSNQSIHNNIGPAALEKVKIEIDTDISENEHATTSIGQDILITNTETCQNGYTESYASSLSDIALSPTLHSPRVSNLPGKIINANLSEETGSHFLSELATDRRVNINDEESLKIRRINVAIENEKKFTIFD